MSRHTVWIMLCSIASLGAGAEEATVAEEEPLPRCRGEFQLGGAGTEDVRVGPDRVLGAEVNLKLEDGVFFGFVHGGPSRFRFDGDRISGTVANLDLMLGVHRSDHQTEVSGLVGNNRVVARASDTELTVSTQGSALGLKLQRGNRMRGQVSVHGDVAGAELVTFGCPVSLLWERPELLVVLFMWRFGA
jgi:hypothetical protein